MPLTSFVLQVRQMGAVNSEKLGMRTRPLISVLLAVLLGASAAYPAFGQEQASVVTWPARASHSEQGARQQTNEGEFPLVADKQGRWRPFRVAVWAGLNPTSLSPEHLIVREKLIWLANVFKQVKTLNPPMGMEVWPVVHVGRSYLWEDPGLPGPLPSHIYLAFHGYYLVCQRRPKCEVQLGTVFDIGGFVVSVNSIGAMYGRPKPQWQDEQGAMFPAPRIVGQVAGFLEYNTGFIVLTRIRRPLWLLVSQERFIRYQIRYFKEELAAAEKDVAKGSPYQQWLREKEKRLRVAEDTYRELQKSDSKRAEEVRTGMEKMEREVGERLKADEAKTQAGMREGLERARRHIQALEAELASLSPAARASPAYCSGDLKQRPSGLADEGMEGAAAVVATNSAFFDPKLAKTSVQLLAVKEYPKVQVMSGDTKNEAILRQKLVEILKTLDWKLLESFLD